jgi:hypothetical protein
MGKTGKKKKAGSKKASAPAFIQNRFKNHIERFQYDLKRGSYMGTDVTVRFVNDMGFDEFMNECCIILEVNDLPGSSEYVLQFLGHNVGERYTLGELVECQADDWLKSAERSRVDIKRVVLRLAQCMQWFHSQGWVLRGDLMQSVMLPDGTWKLHRLHHARKMAPGQGDRYRPSPFPTPPGADGRKAHAACPAAIDAWHLGLFVYESHCGAPLHRYDDAFVTRCRQPSLQLDADAALLGLNDSGCTLAAVLQLLDPDPATRLSVEGFLQHEYFFEVGCAVGERCSKSAQERAPLTRASPPHESERETRAAHTHCPLPAPRHTPCSCSVTDSLHMHMHDGTLHTADGPVSPTRDPTRDPSTDC